MLWLKLAFLMFLTLSSSFDRCRSNVFFFSKLLLNIDASVSDIYIEFSIWMRWWCKFFEKLDELVYWITYIHISDDYVLITLCRIFDNGFARDYICISLKVFTWITSRKFNWYHMSYRESDYWCHYRHQSRKNWIYTKTVICRFLPYLSFDYTTYRFLLLNIHANCYFTHKPSSSIYR